MRPLILLFILLFSSSSFSASVLSGLDRSGSYGFYNHIYQWEFNTTSNACRNLGHINIGVGGVFNADLSFSDLAMLSDRRIAITHTNTAYGYAISILSPQYDASGLLTNLVIDATLDNIVNGTRIAPLPNLGFVTLNWTTASLWTNTGLNTWGSTLVSGINGTAFDIAGLIRADDIEFVVGEYITPPGGSGARSGHKYNSSGKIASYYNNFLASKLSWGYGIEGEGIRHSLLSNGWVTMGYAGNSYYTYIYDGTQTNNAWYDGFKGEITEAGNVSIADRTVTSLSDGRIVIWWKGGWTQTVVGFKVFTLVQNPGGRTGTIGADGEDFYVEFSGNYPNQDRSGLLAGDYMYVAPPKRYPTVFRFR